MKKKVILLFGPTAVGKTDILFKLFKAGIEIINADSMQVYKYMDIGTSKPEKAQLETLTHHLIDIIPPDKQFNTGEFVRNADILVNKIYLRGMFPVLSGGAGFYLKNFAFGLPIAPDSNEVLRNKLLKKAKDKGLIELYNELIQVDPVYAKKISCNDKQRIIRALEVFYSKGKPLSSYKMPDKLRENYDFLLLGLLRPRDELKSRIDLRVDYMFKMGLVDEIRKLKKNGF